MKALVSIHDVMPETMDRVAAIVERVPASIRRHLMLLVVPGRAWENVQLNQLRRWQEEGLVIAGHGWMHYTDNIHSVYHRLHSALVSRRVAEHLSLTPHEELSLMRRNREWFRDQALAVSDWYVAPAWAFGRLKASARRRSGYRYFESTFGVYDGVERSFHWMPMLGYEADTRWRRHAVRWWNALNRSLSRWWPVRLVIHPDDFDLYLVEDLLKDLQRVEAAVEPPDLTARWCRRSSHKQGTL